MNRQLLTFLMATLACASTATAANYSWLGIGSSSNWTIGGNWWNLDTGAQIVPAASDTAIIGFVNGAFNSTPRPVIDTVLYNLPGISTGPLGYLGMDWWNEVEAAPENASITIAAGGGLEVNNTWMNAGGQETATINITGGYLRSFTQLHMAMTAGGTSKINIDSGFLVAQSLLFGPGTSNIDLEPGAALYIGGNQTANMANWINSGKISAGSGSWNVEYDLTSIPGYTTVFAVVPEPSTIALASLGGLALLRRRR